MPVRATAPGERVQPFVEAHVGDGGEDGVALLRALGVLERAFPAAEALLLRGQAGLEPQHLSLASEQLRLAGSELQLELGQATLLLVLVLPGFGQCLLLPLGELPLELVKSLRTLLDVSQLGGETSLALVGAPLILGPGRPGAFLQVHGLRGDVFALGRQLLLGGLQRRGTLHELVGRSRDALARVFELRLALAALGLAPRECRLVLAQPCVRGLELLLAPLVSRLSLREPLLTSGEGRLCILELELACAQGRLALGEVALARDELIEPLLDLVLAPRTEFFGVRTIGLVDPRALAAPQAERATALVQPRVECLEVPASPLDLELATGHVGRALAEGALQLFQLDELLCALVLALLGQPPREAEQLLAVWVLRLLPRGLPADGLPGVFGSLHSTERSVLGGEFGRSEQGKTSRDHDRRSAAMPGKRATVKNEKQYEKLKEKGMSKQRAARIANSPGASSRGGKKSGSGSRSRSSSSQGGTTAQKKAAGRKGGKAAARKK